MISELAGFTLTRAIPDKAMLGIFTGAYKVFGGVIRDNAGRIVVHLANASTPLGIAAAAGAGPVGVAAAAAATVTLDAVNAFQLHKVRKDLGELKDGVAAIQAATSQIIGLAQGTMVLSGLTLAVSAAGFGFPAAKNWSD